MKKHLGQNKRNYADCFSNNNNSAFDFSWNSDKYDIWK